ncbi:RHS repeat-associated protein [Stenotrophomonas sp. 2619]|uniref:RHS repeat-associated core domain-containing protein n=1 Tax=Stenotrophomonas sp. 2619 TaxID=3156316 RepID=UPI00339B3A7C
MDWDHDQKACTRKAVAKLSTRPMFCQANDLQHNPCNVNTGDKYQSEIDFALPWISFVRHYHSSHSTPNSALGPAWTHELAQQLYVSTSSYAALVKGNGDVLPFHEGEAVDGSGWRIAISNGKYEVVTPKTIFRFESNRLFQVEDVERGTLNLTYDGTGRLTRVRHATGRSATFEYDNASQGGQGQLTAVRVEGVLLVGYAYDSDGRLVSAVYPDATFREYQYEDSRFPSHLTGIIDESGVRYSSYEYNVDGLVTVSKHADDTYRGEFAYQADGSTVFTDPNGRRQTFWFNSDGAYRKVSRIADSRGEESIRYAASGDDFRRRPLERVSRMGARSTYAYSLTSDSALGQVLLTKTTEAAGTPDARISQEWVQVSSGRTTRSQRGNRSLDTRYNGRGQPVSFTESYTGSQDARVTSIKYCEAADIGAGACPVLGLMMSIDGPRSDVVDVTRFIYRDADEPGCGINLVCSYRKGDLWKTVNALGQYAEVLSYDFAGRVTAIRDINGVTSHFGFDLRGRPSAVTIAGPDGTSNGEHSRTEIKYLPTGLISEVSRNDGESVAFAYDPAHRLISVGAAGDGVVEFVLDDAGNRLKEDGRDRLGNLVRTLSKTYDEFGRLRASSDASLNSTIHRYDSSDNLEGVTDALGRVFRLEHDPLGRPVRAWSDLEGVAAEILYSYNEFDELSGVVDPKGLRTSYTYDGFGHLTGQVSPDTGSTKFATDTAGNLRTRTDARGIQTAYHYDALNRLIGIAYPDPNLDIGYTYDVAPEYCAADERFAKGRLGTVLYASGRTSYCYDRFGQVVRKTQLVDGVTTMLHFAYTKFGRLDAVTYPDGSVVDYVRDAQGHVREVGLSRLGKGRKVVVSEVTHAPFGPPTGWTYGNGRRLHRPFDLNYWPEAVHDASAGGLSIGFGYDAVGSITNLKNGVGTSILASYGYDALGRLTETRDGDTSVPIEAYTYDATGNRTSLTTASGTTSYIYPADSHHLVSVAGEVRIYNAAGNTVSIGAKEFEYNDANRMSAVKQAGVVVEKYSYNHRGERVLREPLSGNAQVTLYDEAGQWIGNYDAAGHPLQQAIWLDNYPIALINAPSAGVPEVAYVQPDHLGTPRVVIDPIRDVAIWEWSSKGEAFGNQLPNTDADGDGASFEVALRFPGQQATDASGMFYNYQRDYDPAVGRYSQSDPVGLAGGISTYSYVGGAPLSYVDPFGLLRYHAWVQSKYPNTVAYLNEMRGRMTKRKYDGFEYFGKIGRRHLDRLLEPCVGPVITPMNMRHDHGRYTPGGGEIYIHESYFDRFEAGDRAYDLLSNFNRTIEHELVHFAENFWNRDKYRGEEGWGYEKYVYGEDIPVLD